jgi:NDP-sugar pyrophosphorylase family protein
MKISLFFFFAFFLLSFSTCIGGFGFIFKEHLFGDYYLVAPDAIEQCALSYHTEADGANYGTVIEETVFAVGYNEKYLIAKRYYSKNWDGTLDKSEVEYCILPLKEGMNWRTKNGLIETTDSLAFENRRKELGISGLKFTRIIDIP